MKNCLSCGKEINDGAAFCPYCGSPAAGPASSAETPPETGGIAGQPNAPGTEDASSQGIPVGQQGPYQGAPIGAPPAGQGSYYPGGAPNAPQGQYYPGGAPNTPQGQYYPGGTPTPPQGQYNPGGAPTPPPGQYYPGGAPIPQQGQYYPGGAPIPPQGQYNPGGAPTPPQGQYYPGGAPTPPQGQYNPGGAPSGAQGPYYPGSPYSGGPNYPKGGPGNNKMMTIIIIAVIAVVLIGGGIFAFIKLTNKDDPTVSYPSPPPSSQVSPSGSPKPSASAAMPTASSDSVASPPPSASAKPTASASPKPSASPSQSAGNPLATFNSETAENITKACKLIGLDVSLITNVSRYGEWFDGPVYSFTYKDSVVDLFLYEDDYVYSIETGGVQVYLDGYAPYKISDLLGSKTHYDEAQPKSGYVVYLNGEKVDSTIHFKVADKNNYLFALLNNETGKLVSAFIVTNEKPLNMVVPAGTYAIKFASGDKWQGVKELFGSKTRYFEANKTVTLSAKSDINVTLDITGTTGIAAKEIDAGDF